MIDGELGLFPSERVVGHTVLIDQILKLTLPPGVADRAIQRMGNQQELKLRSAGFDDLGRIGQDLHSAADGIEASGDEAPAALLLNHTEPAGAKRNQPSIMAKGRDSDPCAGRSLEDHRSRRNGHFDPVNLQGHHSLFRFLIRHKPFMIRSESLISDPSEMGLGFPFNRSP